MKGRSMLQIMIGKHMYQITQIKQEVKGRYVVTGV